MTPRPLLVALVAVTTSGVLWPMQTAAQEPMPYGSPITLNQARKVMAAAEAEAKKQKWPVAIAVVDGSGFLVAFARLDNTQLGSVQVAQAKARSAALFRRPTKAFEDSIAAGGANLKFLKLPGAV